MKDLAAVFEHAGCSDVQTYIQSGNVIFRASASKAAKVSAAVTRTLLDRTGLRVPVVLRTSEELAKTTRTNPFLETGSSPELLHVMFLADLPSEDRVATLDPRRSPPDEFAVRGRDIYLRCPQGVGKSKLTNAYFDTHLRTVTTMRNWRTLLKLVDICADP